MNKQSSEIRVEFLDFFKNNGCSIIPSDSLIPTGDTTLLFTSAGMVQFKQHFLGQSRDLFTRAASCQRCFRTSDIEQVGITTRHLTFFEMLGNFSFGDYFKKEAIAWAWEFLTKNMGLPKSKLYITVYKNDEQAMAIWKKIVPENRIIRMSDETNFWHMGDTGPCGPCSEILIDLGLEMSCKKSTCGPGCNCDRYLEIWNLVFPQFDKQSDGSLKNLLRKNIDTGMGIERIIAAVNGKKNIFDTDLFIPIVETASEILKIKKEERNISKLRLIADHSRAATFLISDGILPSNEGRGYVLRRILRRALRQGKLCGYNKPFINELALTVFKIMDPVYPGLSSKLSNIKSIIKVEEEKFLETLDSGSVMIFDVINSYKSKGLRVIDGAIIFKLYSTYGFPYDLTKEIVSENGLIVDEVGFKTEEANAQKKSRAAWSGSGEKDITLYSVLWQKIGDTPFVGYDNYISESKILALIKDGKEVDKLKTGEDGEIIISQTPFYVRSGGQSADRGIIKNNNFQAFVKDVLKPIDNLFIHKIKVLSGILRIGDITLAVIDIEHRKQISNHHTATHLLHAVLRETFGKHLAQTGSFITNNYLRFDFTHFSAIKKEDLTKIEKRVNALVRMNLEVHVESVDIVKALNKGAIALFSEKYGDIVRTIAIKNGNGDGDYSIELCCGTHVNRTGDIGIFKIISESSIASGVRRIEAVVGIAAEDYILKEESFVVKTAEILNVSKEELVNKVQKYVADYKKLKNELISLKCNLRSNKIDSYIKRVKKINGVNFLFVLINDEDVNILRDLSDQLKSKLKSVVLLLVSRTETKVFFVVSATVDCVQKGINASELAKVFAKTINGSGGGRDDFAQGGSKDISKIKEGIKTVQKYVEINVSFKGL
jgi:alanyl-tRNA synthetase